MGGRFDSKCGATGGACAGTSFAEFKGGVVWGVATPNQLQFKREGRTALLALACASGCAARQESATSASQQAHDRNVEYTRAENHHIAVCGSEIAYPADALKEGVGGDVILSVDINERGVPTNATLVSSRDERLTAAVIENLGKCRFEIARNREGKPIGRTIPRYTFHFEPLAAPRPANSSAPRTATP